MGKQTFYKSLYTRTKVEGVDVSTRVGKVREQICERLLVSGMRYENKERSR